MRTTAELRDHILAAARAEFARHGLAGSRIDRVARAAHASKERLYAHFGDKEALFREVVSADVGEFYRAASLTSANANYPDAVPNFVGAVYDLACRRPEHLRMLTWARLEGLALGEPQAMGQSLIAQTIAAIESAQAAGHVDSSWNPAELLTLLFAIALAWAQSPDPEASTEDRILLASRRDAAVEAARRIVARRG